MKPHSEDTSNNHDPTFATFAYGLLVDILAHADNPARMNRQLVTQLRELTGARLVVLARWHELEGSHELVASEPERRRLLAESEVVMALAAMTRDLAAPTRWEPGEVLPEAKTLLEEDVPGPTVAVPLRVGEKQVGVLLLFGLQDKHSLDQVIDALGTLARVVALVLHSTALYEGQEATIATRTRELAESKERLEVTLRSIGDAVISTDIQGNVILMNPIAEGLTGWSEAEAMGRPLGEIFPIINEQTRQPVENPVDRVLSEGRVIGLANHTLLLTRDGNEIPIADSGAPIRDAQEKISGVVLVFRDQTEERSAQKALRENEELLQQIADNYPNSYISIIGKNLTIDFIAGQEFSKQNLDPAQFVGLTLGQIFGDQTDIVREHYEKTFAGEEQSFKLFINEQYQHHRTVPLYADDGSISRILSVVEDITGRVRAEQTVRRAEQRYRELFEDAPVMYVITRNIEGTPMIVECNQLFCLTLGFRHDELVGRPLADMYTPSSRTEMLEHGGYQRALTGVFTAQERELQARDGRIIPCVVQAVPEVDATGQVSGTRAMYMDISERKQAEERINHLLNQQMAINRVALLLGNTLELPTICQIARQEIQKIVDSPNLGISLYDEARQEISPLFIIGDGQPIDTTTLPKAPLEPETGPQSRTIVTRQPDIVGDLDEQLPRIKTHIVLPTQDRRQARSILTVPMMIDERVIGTMQIQSYHKNAYTSADAELLSGIANQVALAFQNARLLAEIRQHAAVLEQNVAERTTALQARVAQVERLNRSMLNVLDDLQAANRRAESDARKLELANAELESFSYSVSHDLRAPLRGIDGWSHALLEDYGDQLDEQAHQYLDRVRSETQRMGHLINDLLGLSRLNRYQLQRQSVDLTALAQTIAARLQEEQPQRPVEFIIQEGVTAQCDAHLLEIALTNLLNNAFKFTCQRTPARIEFGQIEIEGQPVYFVRDNGVGFDMAHAKKLFGAFQRLHSPADFPGSGIGLATVQRIIHRHDGRVWVEAEVDKGATFSFTLMEKV
ncbi:MAG: PAS domain S-box protein [Chloroflexi bacterium]|nr:PAS domain S-box protein [Chloroflexota bacterium]